MKAASIAHTWASQQLWAASISLVCLCLAIVDVIQTEKTWHCGVAQGQNALPSPLHDGNVFCLFQVILHVHFAFRFRDAHTFMP
jgi:hypothetical protein